MFSRRKTEPIDTSITPPGLANLPETGVAYHIDAWWWLVAAVVGIIAILSIAKPDPYWRIIVFVRDGISVTILITVVSFILMLVVGMLGGLGRISTNKIIHLITTLYVEIVRGIPLLVQLIWWYFAFPVIIKQIGAWIHFAPFAEYRSNAILLAIFGFVFCVFIYLYNANIIATSWFL